MNNKITTAVLAATFALALPGCASLQASIAEAEARAEKRKAEIQQNAEAIPVCRSQSECDRMWALAIDFLGSRTGLSIKLQTDILIQNEGPYEFDGRFSGRVIKVPVGDDAYEIQSTFRNGLIFENGLKMKADFNKYVGGVE